MILSKRLYNRCPSSAEVRQNIFVMDCRGTDSALLLTVVHFQVCANISLQFSCTAAVSLHSRGMVICYYFAALLGCVYVAVAVAVACLQFFDAVGWVAGRASGL